MLTTYPITARLNPMIVSSPPEFLVSFRAVIIVNTISTLGIPNSSKTSNYFSIINLC